MLARPHAAINRESCIAAHPSLMPTLQAAESNVVAVAVGLRYVSVNAPGITRHRVGKSFSFRDVTGRKIGDEETLRRIRSLAIPPAYREVWICSDPHGHIQATGLDARGRKQYRYHPRWREVRDAVKFHRMLAFAEALPKIREATDRDLKRPGMPREKILATVVRLLEQTRIRVGNEEYARENDSFGLTTMRNEHVEVHGATVSFSFRGKSGKDHEVAITDRRLARVVQRCLDIPGYELFQYLDDDGKRRSIDSADVNDYLRSIAVDEFTAKDFRTWAGTVHAAELLRTSEAATSQRDARSKMKRCLEEVSRRLGNTPAVCRKSYVHPVVFDAFTGNWLSEVKVPAKALSKMKAHELASPHALSEAERFAVSLLTHRRRDTPDAKEGARNRRDARPTSDRRAIKSKKAA